jgi:hypothetical protein
MARLFPVAADSNPEEQWSKQELKFFVFDRPLI